MANEMVVRGASAPCSVMDALKDTRRLCADLMQTKHFAAMGEAGLFAIVQKAKSLNIDPLDAINGGLYYVQGKVGMSSEMMASLIRQRGHSIIKDPKSDNSVCILSGRRIDNGDTWTVTFSMEDAKRAGLARGMYDKYPSVMLYNRAMGMLARQLFPDIIKGAGYTHEELMEIKGSSQHVTVRETEAAVEIISSEQADELEAILSECETSYQASVAEFLRKGGIDSVRQLPMMMHERLRTAAIRKREEARAKAVAEPEQLGEEGPDQLAMEA
jgi:hypothetical protein